MLNLRGIKICIFFVELLLQQLALMADSACLGKYQIPANTSDFQIQLRNISNINYERFFLNPAKATLENNGQTIIIRYTYNNERPYVEEGPLGDEKYVFEFMYFNWLSEESKEFGVPARIGSWIVYPFPVELHVVFSNMRFANFEAASKKNLGIAIMSFKHAILEDRNNILYEILGLIRNPHETTYLEDMEAPDLFTATRLSTAYYVYLGQSNITQLTPESCSADVIWLDFIEQILITPEEAQNFRDLRSFNDVPLMSKISMSMFPNSTVYKTIDRYEYTDNGWTAETFEGFGEVDDSATESKAGQVLIIMLIVGIAMGFFE